MTKQLFDCGCLPDVEHWHSEGCPRLGSHPPMCSRKVGGCRSSRPEAAHLSNTGLSGDGLADQHRGGEAELGHVAEPGANSELVPGPCFHWLGRIEHSGGERPTQRKYSNAPQGGRARAQKSQIRLQRMRRDRLTSLCKRRRIFPVLAA